VSKWNRAADLLEAVAVVVGSLMLATAIVLLIGLVIERYL